MKNLQFDLLVNNILLAEGATPKTEVYSNKKFNLTKFKDKAEEAKEAMKMLAGAKWLGGITVEKIETIFNNLIENLGEEPITYSDLITIIDSSMRDSFSRQDLRVKWSRQFRNMFERLNDIQETGESQVSNNQPESATPPEAEGGTETTPVAPSTPVSQAPKSTQTKSLDLMSKRFWEKILGEGEYGRKDLVRMFIEDNPDVEEGDAAIKISDLIMSGYLKKTESNNYEAADPAAEEDKPQSKEEGEGTGEEPTLDPEDLEDFEDYDSMPTGSYDDEGRPFKI